MWDHDSETQMPCKVTSGQIVAVVNIGSCSFGFLNVCLDSFQTNVRCVEQLPFDKNITSC